MVLSNLLQNVQNSLQVGLLLVAVLGIVVFVHELGHFLAAKSVGVTVLKFSLGMGPEIFGFTRGGTRYCLSWIPLGGFVQMAGDSPNEDGSLPTGGPEQFLTHPWPGRIWIAVAGPLANLITAYVVMVIMCLHGITQPDFPSVLGAVPDTSAAWQAGLREGDRVLSLGGKPVKTWHDMESIADARNRKESFAMAVERGTQTVTLELSADRSRPVLGGLEPQARPAIVGSLMTGMPAYRAGVQEGDRILAVDGHLVTRFDEIVGFVRPKVDKPVHLTLRRGQSTLEVNVTPITAGGKSAAKDGVIGIEAPRGMTWTQRFGVLEAFKASFSGTGDLVKTVYAGMWLSISRPVYYHEYVGGPIFIAQMARDSARKGLDQFLYFLAMINVAIMSFNLLPVPLLDGGHITLALLEAVRRRALSGRAYINFQKVGLVLVGTLFVLILSKDIVRTFQRMHALDKAPRETTTVAPSPH